MSESERPRRSPLRCLVVHPAPVLRRGLVAVLEDELDVAVTEVSTEAEAKAWLRSHAVDLVIAGLDLPDGWGLDLVGRADRSGRRPAWVVLSARDGGGLVAEALRRGAVGLLQVTSEPSEIVRVAATAVRGELAFTATQLEAAREAAPRHLTPRERAVVGSLAAGRSNDEIATDLGLRRKTVETYLARLYRRFGVTSRVELLHRLRDEGLDGAAE